MDNQIIEEILSNFKPQTGMSGCKSVVDLINYISSKYSINPTSTDFNSEWKKEMKKLSEQEKNTLYHQMFMAWIGDSEFVSIQDKLTKRMCCLLKELLKPSKLVLSGKCSLYLDRRVKNDTSNSIYYVPNPLMYKKGNVFDRTILETKTNEMLERMEIVKRRKQREEELIKNPPKVIENFIRGTRTDERSNWRVKRTGTERLNVRGSYR